MRDRLFSPLIFFAFFGSNDVCGRFMLLQVRFHWGFYLFKNSLLSFLNLKLVGEVRMFIAVTIKRYRAVKEVGKIKMSVGIIAYYQVMQVCQAEYFRQLLKPVT